jgi:hypothetical protein
MWDGWMHTCYSLCTNEVLNLVFSNHNLLTRLLHFNGVSQLNKWVRDPKWTSRGSIYTPLTQFQSLCANSAFFVLTGRASRYDRTRPVSGQQSNSIQTAQTDRTPVESDLCWPDVSNLWNTSLRRFCTWPDSPKAAFGQTQLRPVTAPEPSDIRPCKLRVRSGKP